MQRFLPIAAIVIGGCVLAPSAWAQAASVLPTGGQTIGGPGVLTGGVNQNVWASHDPIKVCATVAATAGTATVTLRLNPSGIDKVFHPVGNTITLCSAGTTSVAISQNTGTVFWRVDQAN